MAPDLSAAARRGQDPLVDQSNFSVERLPGLVVVFEQFAEASRPSAAAKRPLKSRPSKRPASSKSSTNAADSP
jgi:hypothetical protein